MVFGVGGEIAVKEIEREIGIQGYPSLERLVVVTWIGNLLRRAIRERYVRRKEEQLGKREAVNYLSTFEYLATKEAASNQQGAYTYAQNYSSPPMVLKALIELDVLEIFKKAGPGARLHPVEIPAQLATNNP
ncbi:hypothetical protein Ancab_010061 [Ancistrocladus abbreviatus]